MLRLIARVARVVCSSSTIAIATFSRALLFVACGFAFQWSLKLLSRPVYAVGRGSESLQSHIEQGAARHTTYRDLATLPSEASQTAQPRASTSAAPPRAPTAETQAGKQASRTEPARRQRDTQAQPSVQEEGSGYLSTESDSDTGTNKKTQVCWWQIWWLHVAV